MLLSEYVAPLVSSALSSGAIDSWFFIRYSDPHFHVRLRLRGDPTRLRNEVLPMIEAAARTLLERNQLWKFQLDTYERELERYGGEHGMVLAEQIFFADSEAVLAILEKLDGEQGADARWRLTLRGMDMLLDDLGFDLDGKLAVARECRTAFRREFSAEGLLSRQLGDKFRVGRAGVSSNWHPVSWRQTVERSEVQQRLASNIFRRASLNQLSPSATSPLANVTDT